MSIVTALACDTLLLSTNQRAQFMFSRSPTNHSRESCFTILWSELRSDTMILLILSTGKSVQEDIRLTGQFWVILGVRTILFSNLSSWTDLPAILRHFQPVELSLFRNLRYNDQKCLYLMTALYTQGVASYSGLTKTLTHFRKVPLPKFKT